MAGTFLCDLLTAPEDNGMVWEDKDSSTHFWGSFSVRSRAPVKWPAFWELRNVPSSLCGHFDAKSNFCFRSESHELCPTSKQWFPLHSNEIFTPIAEKEMRGEATICFLLAQFWVGVCLKIPLNMWGLRPSWWKAANSTESAEDNHEQPCTNDTRPVPK